LEVVAVGPRADCCPVCETETRGLLDALRQRLAPASKGYLDQLGETIGRLTRSVNDLRQVEERYAERERKLAAGRDDLTEAGRRVGRLVGRELADTDDALALLNAALGDTEASLHQLRDGLGAKQGALDGIDASIQKVRAAREVLQREEKNRALARIRESAEY